MAFDQEFIIHPVGQGLFYSGLIKYQNEVKFRMVFDCGSLTAGAGQDEVNIYRDVDFLNKKVIDLLVISHFDKDHVNHIGRLLADGIKVKKLVMPFLTFTERLFLAVRHIETNNGINPDDDDDFFIRFTIDPLGTLNENLDGDSEVLLIESGPIEPIPPSKEESTEKGEPDADETRFKFDFENSVKESIQANDIISTKTLNSKIFKIKDSKTGNLYSNTIIKLMEFLFYKRAIGKDEAKFYEKVKELFFKKFSIDNNLVGNILLETIIDKVKTITSGTEIKKIFEEAKEISEFTPFTGIDISDLNTTALCMLHRNLSGIFNFVGYPASIKRHSYYILNDYNYSGITHIQKFISPNGSRIETQNFFNRYPYPECYYVHNSDKFIYPNALLTSDSFLLTQDQVSKFINHYQNYWDDYWLFQIPHHGSHRNSDSILHSAIPTRTNNFINYGIGNRDHHPHAILIQSLVTSGNSVKSITINQFSGIRFKVVIG